MLIWKNKKIFQKNKNRSIDKKMLEIKNKQKFPVQLVIRSKRAIRSFTVLNIPGVGSQKNVYLLEDERTTEYVDRAEQQGLISVKQI